MSAMRVLIADDDAVSRMMIERTLRQMGYEVVPVNNGRDALRELRRADSPGLALLDWMMPEMDGPQVCSQVRAAGMEKYTYLALLTSRDSPDDLVAGLDAGADDYLTKPCNPAELRARLRTGERILRLEDNLVAAREAMRFRATHDALTRIWNRATVLEFLENRIQRSRNTAVLLCDIDHFKKINDRYGHLTGDMVLAEVAGRLRSAVRAGDVVGRYGGEEFLIVLEGCDERLLPSLAEELRVAVSGTVFSSSDGPVPVTVSIGVATLTPHENSWELMLHRADAALYEAKRRGRNRVILAGQAGEIKSPDSATPTRYGQISESVV